jgi:hypothetical protein
MSYRLPKYYFQDIHPDVMDRIMREIDAALLEPPRRRSTIGATPTISPRPFPPGTIAPENSLP